MNVAFALGGLAGNNAHGAGFLQAALNAGVQPLMISCTSGQLLWAWRYLHARKSQAGSRGSLELRRALEDDIEQVRTFHNDNLDWATLALFGKSGVYRPAAELYFADWIRNVGEAVSHMWEDKEKTFWLRRSLECFPCRLLLPDFPASFFAQISADFNDEREIGLAFNSYDAASGIEYVYLNDRARELLIKKSDDPRKRYQPDEPSSYRDRTIYKAISPDGVRAALWLYQYGFDGDKGARVDGAYYRGIILSELTPADAIYVVRPLHFHWSGDLPRNVLQMEDFKTKVAFNAAYAGERYQIRLINKMLESGKIDSAARSKYHPIELLELEMERTRSFFDYVFEDVAVFDDAYESARTLLDTRRLAPGNIRNIGERSLIERRQHPR